MKFIGEKAYLFDRQCLSNWISVWKKLNRSLPPIIRKNNQKRITDLNTKAQNHTITKEKHHFKTLRKGNTFALNIKWKNNGKKGRLLSKTPLRKWKGNKLKGNICKIYDKRPISIIPKEPLKFNEDNRPNKKWWKTS